LIIGVVALFACSLSRAKPLLIFITFASLQLLAYTLKRAPSIVGANLLAAYGLVYIVSLVDRLRKRWQPSLALTVLRGAVIGALVSVFCFDSIRYFRLEYFFTGDYREVGTWLRENARPEDDVAVTEIGYLAYYSRLRIVDIHGLLNPEWGLDLEARPYWWLEKDLPDFIVTHVPPWHGEPSEAWPREMYKRFAKSYSKIKVSSSGELVVWGRTSDAAHGEPLPRP
jgi:hypothetical protein